MAKISLDEIPKYSGWVSRLLRKQDVFHKTYQEVWREYDTEKWNEVLSIIRSVPQCTLRDLHERIDADGECAGISLTQGLCLQTMKAFSEEQIQLYAQVVDHYRGGGGGLSELGAGYGEIILRLAKRFNKAFGHYLAGELTNTGLNALQILAHNENIPVISGNCDFRSLTVDDCISKYPGGVLYTSYALMYVPMLVDEIVDFFCSMHPAACIHFEPVYELYDEQSLHGLLCRRYVEMNDYNRNLLSVLQNHEMQGKIRIVEIRKNIFGNNVLLPISVIVWKPVQR